jgi:hypothetical protein
MHDTTVASQDTTVASQDTIVASQDTTVASHDTTAASHDTTVASQETTAAMYDTTATTLAVTLICWQATPAFHDTTATSHDTTATSYDTTKVSPDTTAIRARVHDVLQGPITGIETPRSGANRPTLTSRQFRKPTLHHLKPVFILGEGPPDSGIDALDQTLRLVDPIFLERMCGEEGVHESGLLRARGEQFTYTKPPGRAKALTSLLSITLNCHGRLARLVRSATRVPRVWT